MSDRSTLIRDYRRLHATVAMAPIAMFEANIDATATWANVQWCELIGVPASEAVGQLWFETVHTDDLLPAVASWDIATRKHVHFGIECRVVGRDNAIRWVCFKGAPLLDPATGISSYVVTGIDTTDQHRLDEISLTLDIRE